MKIWLLIIVHLNLTSVPVSVEDIRIADIYQTQEECFVEMDDLLEYINSQEGVINHVNVGCVQFSPEDIA